MRWNAPLARAHTEPIVMLSYLSEFESTFGPLRLLRFITFRTLLAAMIALVIGFAIGPWLIRRLKSFTAAAQARVSAMTSIG